MNMVLKIIIAAVIVVVVLLLILLTFKIVPQSHAFVIERFGKYRRTLDPGLHVIFPVVDRVARRVNMMEQVADFPPQPVITKDNVTMRIDSVLYFRIEDPKAFAYGVSSPLVALENLTATTLRNIIGELELDETLSSREAINAKMKESMILATNAWGILPTRVELKNITPPAAIQDAMEKQMKAERERREAILIAEGEKQSAILVAEGNKQSAILNAEGEKEAAILHAQAAKESAILRAEAAKEASIREAEGHGKAIIILQEANAQGIEALNQKKPSPEVLKLKSLEAFAKAADGKATKIIIPSEIQSMAGLLTSVKELGGAGTPVEGEEKILSDKMEVR